MDILTIAEIIGALAVGGVVVYLVAIQGVKAAINREAKGIALDTVFKQFGLQRKDVKFWNDLQPAGVANICAVLKTVQASSGQVLGGVQSAGIAKAMSDLQAFAAMAGQMRPQLGNPQTQPTQ